MSWLSSIMAGSISGLLVLWIWTKFQSWNGINEKDRASIRIMEIALLLLPEEEREFYHEEWFMFLCDIDNPTDRLKHAFGFFKAAAEISMHLKYKTYSLLATSIALITARVIERQLKRPVVQDAFYYVGFIMTLGYLGIVFYKIGREHGMGNFTAPIIQEFGLALIFTIIGLLIRVILRIKYQNMSENE